MLQTKLSQEQWLNADDFVSTFEVLTFTDDTDKSDNVTTDDGNLHITFYGVRQCVCIGQDLGKRAFVATCKRVLRQLQVTGFEGCFLEGC